MKRALLVITLALFAAIYSVDRRPAHKPEGVGGTPTEMLGGARGKISVRLPVARPFVPSLPAPGEEAGHKITLLKAILSTGNDNDPRLDTEFENLSVETKRAFRALYRATPRAAVNYRGTLVFLLGQNVKDAEDLRFLAEVVAEPPLVAHSVEVLHSYPQMLAVRAARRLAARPVLRRAMRSKSPVVADAARDAVRELD